MPALIAPIVLIGGGYLALRELKDATDSMTKLALVASAAAGIYLGGKKLKVW
ncbi:hypothetical protein [Parvibaculum sp.]|uniref:hypothetical protein n=1 Tax=Parvibaculum sp. TaxID=2024848 RepID=UPI00391ABEB0